MKNVLFGAAILSLSGPILAHEGHNHDHWSAGFTHLFLYAAIAIAACGVVYAAYKFVSKCVSSDKKEKANATHNVK